MAEGLDLGVLCAIGIGKELGTESSSTKADETVSDEYCSSSFACILMTELQTHRSSTTSLENEEVCVCASASPNIDVEHSVAHSFGISGSIVGTLPSSSNGSASDGVWESSMNYSEVLGTSSSALMVAVGRGSSVVLGSWLRSGWVWPSVKLAACIEFQVSTNVQKSSDSVSGAIEPLYMPKYVSRQTYCKLHEGSLRLNCNLRYFATKLSNSFALLWMSWEHSE